MPVYVQGPDSDIWHWCRNCSNYPQEIEAEEFLLGSQRPTSGELDEECLAKERDGYCRT